MSSTKYILTKYETIRRTEKVEYTVEIPENINNKTAYADEQVIDSNYADYKVVDIVDSEKLDEEVRSLRRFKHNI
jgi:hypothetical protein